MLRVFMMQQRQLLKLHAQMARIMIVMAKGIALTAIAAERQTAARQ